MTAIGAVQAALPAAGLLAPHPRVAAVLRSALDGVDRVARVVVVVALLGELSVVLTDVTIRYLFTQSLLWTEEASKLCLTTLAFLGGASAYRARHHTAIQFVTRFFPPTLRQQIAVAVDTLILCVCLTSLWVSFDLLTVAATSLTPILQISAAWLVLPFTVGMILISLFACERLVLDHPGTVALSVVPAVAALIALVAASTFVPIPRPGNGAALAVMLILFFLTVLLGLPVSFSMLLGSLFYLLITDSAPLIAAAQNTVDGTSHFILLTLPFFIWAGLIMEKGGISVRLVRLAMALVGHLRGGLLQVVVVTIYLVSGISGSKAADVVAVGSVLRRELKRQGYRPEEGAAVLSAAGAMSETIPPSIAMLVLGSVAPISIGTLFVAGLLPAAVIALFLMISIHLLAWRRGTPRAPRAGMAELLGSMRGAILPLIMPVIMIVGIKFGFATPTEVSAVAVLYGIALSVLIYRSIGGRAFFDIAVDCGLLAGMVLFIIAAAGSFAWTLTAANLPAALIAMLHLMGDSPALFLVGSMVLLIVVGSLLEGLPALIILGPLLLPIANQLGIDSIHYAMVILLAMGIGIFIPPIGVCFYISCAVMESDIEASARTMLPYLAVLILGVLTVAFVPWFTAAVPALLGGR
ncbi:MAG TPA: TRAP transporter large permease subunit [Xanthobacteraceae bacterium]